MIPWVREKFAERRARWIASRKRSESTSCSSSASTGTGGIGSGGRNSIGVATVSTANNYNNCGNGSMAASNNCTPNSSRRIITEQQHQQQKSKQPNQNNHFSIKLTAKKQHFKSSEPDQSKQQHSNESLGQEINIKIRSPTGREIILYVPSTIKLIDLKHEALQRFAQDSSDALPLFAADVKQLYTKYRFIRPDSQLEFEEQLTLEQIGISHNETLNLCVKRTNPVVDITNLRGPTITDITLATLNQRQSEQRPRRTEINDFLLQSDLQFDVRKVIISLAQSSAYVIGSGPYAARLISMFKQKLVNKRKHQIDTLQCLVDMGFSREKSAYALKIQNGIYSAALDWLIEHQSDHVQTDDVNSLMSSSFVSRISENNDFMGNIQSLLEIVRIYSLRDVPPPVETVNTLMDMGFSEKDVLKALRITRNNQAAACEWLCGNRSTSLTELRDGLSTESPILKAMMESPQVQMSLSNPKMFIAYLSMLENHNALSMWLGDSDTSLVLSHILKKYHEEKHILGINQLNSNVNR